MEFYLIALIGVMLVLRNFILESKIKDIERMHDFTSKIKNNDIEYLKNTSIYWRELYFKVIRSSLNK